MTAPLPAPGPVRPAAGRLWYEACKAASMAAVTLGFSLRMTGQRNLPRTGPVLLIANHQSFLDPLLVGVVSRRPVVPLARKTLFRNPLFGALIRSLGAVPIDQEGIGKEGLRAIGDQLQRGRVVLVFPEGSRTPDGRMHPLKPGIHLLIKRTQAPVIPVGIAGAYDAWPVWRPYPIPAPIFLPGCKGTVAVALGEPLDARRYADLPRDQALQELADKIRDVALRAEKVRRR